MKNPQVVILAGGLGTRLGPMTQETPKAMVLIQGRPFLEWQIRFFKNQGFTRFLLLTGYKGEKISRHFQDGKAFGVSIEYHQEEKPMGTGGALIGARDLLSEEFLLMFGDSLLPIDGKAVLSCLGGEGAVQTYVAMAVYDNRIETDVPFNVKVQEGRVVDYFKASGKDHGRSDLTFVEAGVYGVKRIVLEGQALRPCSFESELLRPAIENGSVAAFQSSHRFFDIGTPERLKFFESRLNDYFPNSL